MKYIIVSVLFFIIFLIHSFSVIKNKWENIDNNFYKKIRFSEVKTKILRNITNLACTPFFVVISIFLILFLPNKQKAWVFVVGLIINSLLIFTVKHLVKRERPNIKRLVKEKGYSYISGHTLSATFFYGLSSVFIFISNISLTLKVVLILAFILLILIIAYSRIYLGVHYLSDTIGGLLLGISYLAIYIYLTSFLLNLF